jgi:hypothetical protein
MISSHTFLKKNKENLLCNSSYDIKFGNFDSEIVDQGEVYISSKNDPILYKYKNIY